MCSVLWYCLPSQTKHHQKLRMLCGDRVLREAVQIASLWFFPALNRQRCLVYFWFQVVTLRPLRQQGIENGAEMFLGLDQMKSAASFHTDRIIFLTQKHSSSSSPQQYVRTVIVTGLNDWRVRKRIRLQPNGLSWEQANAEGSRTGSQGSRF
jgi:hypothetical protein